MERELVTSRANPLLARVRKLNSRRAFRREENAFAAEGPKLLGEALRWGAELEAVSANEPAIALYRKFGFETTGTVPRAFRYGDGTYADFLFMVKTL